VGWREPSTLLLELTANALKNFVQGHGEHVNPTFVINRQENV
jgi:hypothetical protein